jgi:hypothetical protein
MANTQVKDLTADTSIATTDVIPIQGTTGDMKKITGSNVKASLESGGGIELSLAASQVAAAGSDSQVQYSNAGVTAGDADLVWNDSTKVLQVGASTSTAQVKVPLSNDAATPTVAFGDGDTGLYESADDTIAISTAGTARFFIDSSQFYANNGGGPSLQNEDATSTNPSVCPDRTDTDTGIGIASSDSLSLIAGGVEIVRLIEGDQDFACFRVDDDTVANGSVPTSFCAMYMNESGNALTFKVKYSDGSTVKTGTVSLT